MFQQFAENYFLGRMTVAPYGGDEPAMHEDEYEEVNRQLYGGAEVARLDLPLVMKVDECHLSVYGEDGVPSGTLALPEEVMDSVRVRNPPEEKEVLLATPDANLGFMFEQGDIQNR